MAGDLYIESLTDTHLQTLQAIKATQPEAIYHADRPWDAYQNKLHDRTANNSLPPANRKELPAHAYINFEAANRLAIQEAVGQGNNRLRLANLLEVVSRPLGLISNKAALANWQASNGDQRVTLLLDALNRGSIVLEYYKVGICSVLLRYPNWAQYNE